MLSRVAENLYWMTRYLERAENTARLINTTTNLLLDLPRSYPVSWESLVDILGTRLDDGSRHATEQRVMRYLIDDPENPGSIHACLRQARQNARSIRELLPAEVWEGINELYFLVRDNQGSAVARRHRFEFLRRIIGSRQQITGIIEGTFSHGPPYQFVVLGRYLERADMTTRILDVRAASLMREEPETIEAWDDAGWMSVLRSLGGYIMYRQYMTTRIRGPQVVQFLLGDPHFPRAVRFCLQRIERSLASLPPAREPAAALERLMETIDATDPAHLERAELHEYIDRLQLGLGEIHRAMSAQYFPARQA